MHGVSNKGSQRSLTQERDSSFQIMDEESQEQGIIKPPPISLQLRDFYKMSCGIKTKFGFDRSSKPSNRSAGSSFMASSNNFLFREKTTSEGSLMDTLIKRINNSVGPRDTFRSAIRDASKSWQKHNEELSVRGKILQEHEDLR